RPGRWTSRSPPGAYQTQLADVSGGGPGGLGDFGTDAFVVKLTPSGGLGYGTYLGGPEGRDAGAAIAVDALGNAYVGGLTLSPSFPVTAGAAQTTSGGGQDGFVSVLNAAGSALVLSSYAGGSG